MNSGIKDIQKKYKKKLEQELGIDDIPITQSTSSREYKQFKDEIKPAHQNFYEKACALSEKILNTKPDKAKEPELIEAIGMAHLNITPAGATSFGLLAPLLIILIGSFISFGIFNEFFFVFFFLILGVSLIGPFSRLPMSIANSYRLKASNQMVLCIFYIVTFMRHSSNLEGAIQFASDHLAPPLSLDLRKVLWDVETEKFSTIQESLDAYLETWKKYNFEFIESFHLIESSLYEASDKHRVESLDRALDVILSETYEKMLHYAHNLKSPITMLHMLGIILPILGLVILPLVVSFMGNVKWLHIAALYNVALPLSVYFLGKTTLSTRPSGYGDTDISEQKPELKKYKNVNVTSNFGFSPAYIAIFIGFVFILIGLSPVIIHAMNPEFDVQLLDGKFSFLNYKGTGEAEKGPYGLGASLISVMVTIGLGVSFGLYYKLKSKDVISIRETSKKLETEFASAIFQLGNRLGDGLPVEMAVGRVSQAMQGTLSGNFFETVSSNIRRLGMNINQALFDKKYGALLNFPSTLIESSMKVLVESIRKGPKIAAMALMNISRYIKEIHKVDERLKDLMADILSSMTTQIKFLTPVIAGIVVGITSMVTFIIGKLTDKMTAASTDGGIAGANIADAAIFSEGIPTFYFQIIVGIYVVQITYILTVLSNTISNGSDKLGENYQLGQNLSKGAVLYALVSSSVMLLFNFIAASILSSQGMGII